MVCDRCVLAVQLVFEKHGIVPLDVRLGEVTLENDLIPETKHAIQLELAALGFEWLADKKSMLVEQIKVQIIQFVRAYPPLNINLSEFLQQKLKQDYHSLSAIFSELEQTTIEKYVILQRIERAKELLSYNELNLDEIADQLNYSSTAYLSNQFKKITGMSPSEYRKINSNLRFPLDKV